MGLRHQSWPKAETVARAVAAAARSAPQGGAKRKGSYRAYGATAASANGTMGKSAAIGRRAARAIGERDRHHGPILSSFIFRRKTGLTQLSVAIEMPTRSILINTFAAEAETAQRRRE